MPTPGLRPPSPRGRGDVGSSGALPSQKKSLQGRSALTGARIDGRPVKRRRDWGFGGVDGECERPEVIGRAGFVAGRGNRDAPGWGEEAFGFAKVALPLGRCRKTEQVAGANLGLALFVETI